jgi:hypothetical protein
LRFSFKKIMVQLILKARAQIFENTKFYFWFLMFLIFYTILRYSIDKIVINSSLKYVELLSLFTASIYGVIYLFSIISLFFLKSRAYKLFITIWVILFCISIINELNYSFKALDYSFKESMFSGQAFMNFKITLPFAFLGVWFGLNDNRLFSKRLLKFVEIIVLINSFFIVVGFLFNVSFFESYPSSVRWGYTGFLTRGYNVTFNCIVLIGYFDNKGANFFKRFLVTAGLILSGTKAGILALSFIVFFVIVRSTRIRVYLGLVGLFLIFFMGPLLKWGVSFSPFWKLVYKNHGAWGVFFSLRNEDVISFFNTLRYDYALTDFLIGGKLRYEKIWIEVLPFDFLAFYGLLGCVPLFFLFFKWVPSWKLAIPLLVAFFSGTFFTLGFIIWGIWVHLLREKEVSLK